MKVKRLVEAEEDNINSSSKIQEYEARFLAENDPKKKAGIVREFLGSLGAENKLESISDRTLLSWVDAMKWSEMGRIDNEFISLLKSYASRSVGLSNEENFIKVYNAYSDGSIPKNAGDSNSEIYTNSKFGLLNNPDLYKQSDKDVRDIFKVVDRLKSKGWDDGSILSKLYDNSGQIKTATQFKADVKNDLDKNNKTNKSNKVNNNQKSTNEVKSYISNLSRDDALQAIKYLFNRKDLGATPIAILNELGLIR